MKVHINVLKDTKSLERSISLKVQMAWEQLGDKVNIANDVIYVVNNKTNEYLEVLIRGIIALVMDTSTMNLKHSFII
jgi:hypothetical protein